MPIWLILLGKYMGNLAYSVIATTLDLVGVPDSPLEIHGCPGFMGVPDSARFN